LQARALVLPVDASPPFRPFSLTASNAWTAWIGGKQTAQIFLPGTGLGKARNLTELGEGDVLLFEPSAGRLSEGAITRILEALAEGAHGVSWDEAVEKRRDGAILHPKRPLLCADGADLVGSAWAVRAELWLETLNAHEGNDAAAKRTLAFSPFWRHIPETLSVNAASRQKHIGSAPTPSGATAGPRKDSVDVSIIVPTRDEPALLRACLAGLAQTSPRPVQLIIVDHLTGDPEACALIDAAGAAGATIIRAGGPFNFSRLVNLGAAEAIGDHLCLLNNDVTPLHADSLGALAAWGGRSGVGAVGALLYYPNGRLQHAGLVNSDAGELQHAGAGWSARRLGPGGLLAHTREVLAVTGACLLTPRAIFERLGGMDERFPSDFNDVDYCLRCRESNLAVLCAADVRMRHAEGASRGRRGNSDQTLHQLLRARHSILNDPDPYFSPRNEQYPAQWGLRKLRP